MDLSIVKRKLESHGDESYGSPQDFVADMRLIFINCANYYKVESRAFSQFNLAPTCMRFPFVLFFVLNN